MTQYYSTLQEAYNVDSFSTKKKRDKQLPKSEHKLYNENQIDNFMNDYSPQDDCYYKKYGLNSESCPNNNINKEFKNEFCDKFTNYNSNKNNKASCTSLQAPSYTIPISEDSKKKYNEALNTSLNETNANQISYDDFNKQSNIKSVEPYYDDDLEKYLNINNFQNAINYPPISNNQSSLQQEQQYSQSSSQQSQHSQLSQPKSEASSSSLSNTGQTKINYDNIIHTNNKTDNNTSEYTNINNTSLILPKINNKTNKDLFYKNIINIGLFIFIGIVIILLCDQITEVAINIGMKRTMTMLEPYLEKIKELNNIKNMQYNIPQAQNI